MNNFINPIAQLKKFAAKIPINTEMFSKKEEGKDKQVICDLDDGISTFQIGQEGVKSDLQKGMVDQNVFHMIRSPPQQVHRKISFNNTSNP